MRDAGCNDESRAGASAFQCKCSMGSVRPAVGVGGLARIPLGVGVGIGIGIDLGRPAVGESVLWLTGDVSRIGSKRGHAIWARLPRCLRGAQTGSLAPPSSPCIRTHLARPVSSGGSAATRSAPRSPPPRPWGRGGKGNAGTPAQGCASRAPLADSGRRGRPARLGVNPVSVHPAYGAGARRAPPYPCASGPGTRSFAIK
jgi:hypothetical protein